MRYRVHDWHFWVTIYFSVCTYQFLLLNLINLPPINFVPVEYHWMLGTQTASGSLAFLRDKLPLFLNCNYCLYCFCISFNITQLLGMPLMCILLFLQFLKVKPLAVSIIAVLKYGIYKFVKKSLEGRVTYPCYSGFHTWREWRLKCCLNICKSDKCCLLFFLIILLWLNFCLICTV